MSSWNAVIGALGLLLAAFCAVFWEVARATKRIAFLEMNIKNSMENQEKLRSHQAKTASSLEAQKAALEVLRLRSYSHESRGPRK